MQVNSDLLVSKSPFFPDKMSHPIVFEICQQISDSKICLAHLRRDSADFSNCLDLLPSVPCHGKIIQNLLKISNTVKILTKYLKHLKISLFLWTIMGKISHGHLRLSSVLGPLYAAITVCKLSNIYEAQKLQKAKYNTQITKYGSTEYFRAITWPSPFLVHWVQPMHCIDCVHMRTNQMVKIIGI